MKRLALCIASWTLVYAAGCWAETGSASAMPTIPTKIRSFLANAPQRPHDKAPKETSQFGRLVGLWAVETEMAGADGSWVATAPGLWAWRYTLDGFAVQDLWFQPKERLPRYMSKLGRDYLLMSNRIFDGKQQRWAVHWMANGAGTVMGADTGSFTATSQGDHIVMEAPPSAYGLQRVIFSQIGADSFRWSSEYSQDQGKTWRAVMRMRARRMSSP